MPSTSTAGGGWYSSPTTTRRRLPEYIRARDITWFADFPYAVVGLVFEASRLRPKPKFGEYTKFEKVDATPAYYVVPILWRPE